MGIRENEGRYVRSRSLRDTAVKKKHPLNFMDRAVASHHIISCEATRRLSSYRRKQITNKGYDVNHAWNLVILPMQDKIACHYKLPLHKSSHLSNNIITHYERSAGVNISDIKSSLENQKNSETNQDTKKILEDDLSVIDVLSGYHKIVAVKLARILKGLHCKTDPTDFSERLDDLSQELLGEIDRGDLLLLRRGKHFPKGQRGCRDCRKPNAKTDRIHFGPLDNAPSMPRVLAFCYTSDGDLKTVQQQK
ncbi:AHH domain-containing protein [Vibrio alginolyticus]|uniref:AHH domain-containing protein n=1 Tax=Vibrio TaxID=662 RepID=UPI001CDB688F|nr:MULTISPECIES: AHH domain-containing protein [Vibrio]EGQ8019239.1 hypothetical protein [Vibrio alginolyticus]EGQ9764483.1 hypothetical protein [Vibrio alginolyticus]ELA9081473.1 AHH domain-containing protein [Vibrio alginolyticus]ELA9201185.1 AHH domain-containing protein [Vibrio alginolyticus]ELI1832979.1 AHH domain-containing protein [Vibrio alginolyticus]